jgi:CRISPR system Cascade subunit CasE
MTTLSRIWLNPLRSGGQGLLSSPQRLHAAILGGFPDLTPTDRVLWRLETTNPHRPTLLILGKGHPDWTHLVEQAGWPSSDANQVRVADYDPLLEQVVYGREFRFKITANPVQAVRPPTPGPDGRYGRYARVGHRTEAHQRRWFLERTDRWGFTVASATPPLPAPGLQGDLEPFDTVRVTHRQRHSFSKSDAGKRVVLQTATFEGQLTVTNATALRASLLDGIGPAKAYGCGLLTLAPLQPKEGVHVVAG